MLENGCGPHISACQFSKGPSEVIGHSLAVHSLSSYSFFQCFNFGRRCFQRLFHCRLKPSKSENENQVTDQIWKSSRLALPAWKNGYAAYVKKILHTRPPGKKSAQTTSKHEPHERAPGLSPPPRTPHVWEAWLRDLRKLRRPPPREHRRPQVTSTRRDWVSHSGACKARAPTTAATWEPARCFSPRLEIIEEIFQGVDRGVIQQSCSQAEAFCQAAVFFGRRGLNLSPPRRFLRMILSLAHSHDCCYGV